MGLFGKLFEKKECSVCGGEIGLLGNRKLEDGNLCKACAQKLSPWFSDRRGSTVSEIEEQLEYREVNRDRVAAFRTTRTLGERTKLLLDEDAGTFMVTAERNLERANPDVLEFADVTGCILDIDEDRTELMREEPLYEGCGNETWSVRLGAKSPADENGYPTGTEYHVTLLERDTLLMQRRYTVDGYPAVSYQTFRRMPAQLTWWEVEAHELADTHWECVGYVDTAGAESPVPPGLRDVDLHLNADDSCWFGRLPKGADTYATTDGTWLLANGGVLLLRGGGADSPFWYGGAVRGYGFETEDGFMEGYEMLLHDGAGILRLVCQGYG